jgi:hypothetical protein
LLEKLSDSGHSKQLIKQVFETVADLFVQGANAEFAEHYQLLRTVYRYTKLVDLKESYSGTY